MVTLTSVNISISVRDGVDHDSTAQFQLYHINQGSTIAALSRQSIPNNALFNAPLAMVSNTLPKTEINNTTFYLQIDANGRDTFSGTLNIQFAFSDGSTASFEYGSFQIGTFHMSNSTRKAVSIVGL